ncbi:H-N-H homing endonuclease [Proteus phage PM135]|uniref:H-N-H homing endonuclease n=1 Tax=Proteus phage PM135 TaxID=2048008 RepID=A0A2H4PRN8_9CAUD|nr:H-N-H homing endonuclease [Proteus phage PM135]ATW69957.1 H-N-H homing endonuclease [Proteus phage PM135]
MEGFTPIPEHPEYLVSDSGGIYSTISNRLLRPTVDGAGYLHFAVRLDTRKYKWLRVHRVVCRVFGNLPSLDSTLEVDHINRNKLDNRAVNLNALTPEEHISKTLTDKGLKPGTKLCSCGIPISTRNNTCFACAHNKGSHITIEDIIYWVTNYSWSRASRELGISDNGLRKKYRSLTGKDPKSIKYDFSK